MKQTSLGRDRTLVRHIRERVPYPLNHGAAGGRRLDSSTYPQRNNSKSLDELNTEKEIPTLKCL